MRVSCSRIRPKNRKIRAKVDSKVYCIWCLLPMGSCVWVLLRPTGLWTLKGCEPRPTVYRPYPRKLESLTICKCNYKSSTFSSVIKDSECWSVWSRTHDLPHSSLVLNQLSQRCCFGERETHEKLVLSNELKKFELPPWGNKMADVSRVSPSSER